MIAAALVAVLLILAGPFGAPPLFGAVAQAQPPAPSAPPNAEPPLPPDVVRGHCSVCHAYRLVEQQRLDRANWDWVMGDMIDKYGATWIDPALRARIVDYLVEHYGPER